MYKCYMLVFICRQIYEYYRVYRCVGVSGFTVLHTFVVLRLFSSLCGGLESLKSYNNNYRIFYYKTSILYEANLNKRKLQIY